jgi:predicted secreted Zn-dependent protease
LKSSIRLLLLAIVLASPPTAALAEWQAVEKVQTYAISGKSGIELYQSIGERGPKAGVGRAVAYTDFKLTWRRDYQPKDGACTLVSARPKLIITYRLPKPSEKLPTATQKLWDEFSAGVSAHEKVHGEFIVEMVKAIEAATIGLSVPGDPECKKIRTEMTKRLSALSQAQRQKSRDFDRVELSNGGAVHQLILELVNGR